MPDGVCGHFFCCVLQRLRLLGRCLDLSDILYLKLVVCIELISLPKADERQFQISYPVFRSVCMCD